MDSHSSGHSHDSVSNVDLRTESSNAADAADAKSNVSGNMAHASVTDAQQTGDATLSSGTSEESKTPPALKKPTLQSPPSQEQTPAPETTQTSEELPNSSPSTQQNPSYLELHEPVDATPFRSESQRRRTQPARTVPRRRRRGLAADKKAARKDGTPILEWEKMDSVPLVTGSKQDGWVDLKTTTIDAQKRVEEEERLIQSRASVNENVKEKLKQEVVQPYKQNWILWISMAIALLAIAFNLSGGFDTIPIIPVPDL